jgi:LAO/AO transport system kinase
MSMLKFGRSPMAGTEATPHRADPAALLERMLGGDRLALARLITHVENRSAAVPAIMQAIHARARGAYVVGVTGPPGAGKSTVVDRLTALLRAEGDTVGIVAVDPSSPFSGGAVLGDRIRMQAHALDPGVFIRSMATRGSLGGLARATGEVIKLLGAAGYRWVLIETVGVGQTELDIMKIADTTIVVLVPESGDAIQTMKAGLMEVADVFVVNKADRAGAPALMAELKFAAHLHHSSTASCRDVDWETPVLSLQAQHAVGVPELLAEVRRHRGALEASGAFASRRRERARAELEGLLIDAFRGRVDRALHGGSVKAVFDEVVAGTRDPYSAAAAILPVISLEPS